MATGRSAALAMANCSSGYGCPKHMLGLVVDGLGLYGFISDSDACYIGGGVEFRDVHNIDEAKLGRMLKAIKRVNIRIEKDRATEAGDKLMAFAKALKLSFVVQRIGERRRDPDWRFMSIEEGRNRYRAMIEEAQAEVAARKVRNAFLHPSGSDCSPCPAHSRGASAAILPKSFPEKESLDQATRRGARCAVDARHRDPRQGWLQQCMPYCRPATAMARTVWQRSAPVANQALTPGGQFSPGHCISQTRGTHIVTIDRTAYGESHEYDRRRHS